MARNHHAGSFLTPAPKVVATPVMAQPRVPVWLLAALLVVLTVVLYWPALRCDFVDYDDSQYVSENSHVTSGLSWENARWAFRSGYASNWHPLTWLSHMADCQFFGLKPWGHHLTSILLHALNTALVFLLLRQLTGTLWRSVLVAALFGWHPVHVESVAWVAERKDVLSTFFGLLSLLGYARYAEERKHPTSNIQHRTFNVRGWYWLALVTFALGLMSKPMLVTLPFVMLLLDYWPLGRFTIYDLRFTNSRSISSLVARHSSLLWEKLPFFALAAVAGIVTFAVQQHGGSVAAVDKLPLGARSGNALISYCRYLGKTFWPTDLAVFYPHPGHWPLGQVLLAGGLLAGISLLLIARRRQCPFMLMGWLWFVGTLVPVIGLVQVGAQALADRYTYIPSLGMWIVVVWGVYELARHWRHQGLMLAVAGAAAISLCGAMTRQQLGHWRDGETLFRHALAVTGNNYLAHSNLGTALAKKGRTDEAIRQFQEALRLKPDYTYARNNLGAALLKKGEIDEAILQIKEAIRLKPDHAEAINNLGMAFVKQGRSDEAIRQFQEVVRLKPDDAKALNNLGYMLAERGENLEAARAAIDQAVRLEPKNAAFLDSLGWVLLKQNRPREALDQLLQAIKYSTKPDATLYGHLGDAYDALGRRGPAAEAWRKSLAIEPSPEIHKKLDALSVLPAGSSR